MKSYARLPSPATIVAVVALIVAMGGRDALRFWRDHKDALLSLARACGRSFDPVEAK